MTAAASRSGILTWCRMRVSLAEVFTKKSRMICAALLLEQSLHASVRLLTWFEAPAARMNVFHLQRDDGGITIGRGVPKFSIQVLVHFVVGKHTLLIADAADVRILRQLHVEAHQFLNQVRDRFQAA